VFFLQPPAYTNTQAQELQDLALKLGDATGIYFLLAVRQIVLPLYGEHVLQIFIRHVILKQNMFFRFLFWYYSAIPA
jgi:hypothetical protein